MQKEIKRVHVLQAGMVLGMLYAVLGLIGGLLYGAFFLLIGAVGAAGGGAGGTGGAGGAETLAVMGGMGLFMVILIPILYGALGFVGGIIASAFYNLVAKWVGGLKFDVADIGPVPH